jgi:collagen type III alpha
VATVSDKTQHSYAEADEFIQYQLEKARSRIKATDLLTAGVLAGLVLVGYVLVFTLLDHWVVAGGFSAWTRASLLAVVVVLCGAILFRYVVRPWFRRIHPLYAARMLDRSSEEIQGSLLALVDLQAAGHKSDRAIHRTLEKRAAVTLAEVHVDEAIDRRLLTRMGTGLFIITLITCLYAVLSPKAISLLRPLTFARTNVATRTVIEGVQPGNISIPAGSNLEFVADLAGVIPEEIHVLYSTSDRRFVDEPLTMRSTDDEHRFQILMVGDGDRGIRQDMTYRIEAGDAMSDTFAITVEQPPTARVTEVHYNYPAYMDLPERSDSAGAIEAWEGTTLTVLAESSELVSEAVLQMSDDAAFSVRGEELQMKIDDTQLSVDWTLTQREDNTFPSFYRIQVTNLEGHKDLDPVVYSVDVRRDAPPVVKLIDPTRDLEASANAIVPLLVEAEDPDFLLRSVTLHYAINGKPVQPSEVLLDAFQTGLTKRWADTWEFRLKPLNLNPGDVVTFHIEARDNRPPLGNQSRTGDLNLRITAPVSEQQAKDQLAQDRQMQDQMRPPENNSPGEDQKDPGTQQEIEQSQQPGENTTEPESQPDATSDPDSEQSPDAKYADGQSGEANDQKNGHGEQRREADQTGNASEQKPPESDGSSSRRPDQRAEDDKALQKLIQRMNQDQNNSGSESSNERRDSQGEKRGPDGENSPDRDPAERGDGPGGDDRSEQPKNNSKGGSSPDDLNSSTNDSGNDEHDKTSEETTSEGNKKDEQTRNPSSNQDQGDEKQPSAGPDEPRDGQNEDASGKGSQKSESPESSDQNTQAESDATSEKTTSNDPEASENDNSQEPKNADATSDKEQQASPKSADDQNAGKPDGREASSDEPRSDKPAMQNENPLNMNSTAGQRSDPNKTGDETSKDSEAGGKEPGGKEAGGKEAGGKEAGGKEAGGKEAGGKEPGGKEPGGKEPGGKEPGGKEPGGKEPGGKEAGGKEAGGKEPGGKEAGGKEAGGKEAGGKEAGGKEAGGKEAGGKEAGGKEAGGKEAGGKEAGGKEAGGKEAGGKEAGGKEAGGKEAGGKEAGGKEAGGKEAGGKEAGGKEAGGKEAGGKEAGGKEGSGKEGGGKEGGGKEGGGKEGSGKEGSGKEGSGKEGGEAGRPSGQAKSGNRNGLKDIPRTNSNTSAADDDGERGQGNGGMADADDRPIGEQADQSVSTPTDDPQADDAASAAALAIKRLQQDLDRGNVDQKLLDELGWTESEMKSFADRLERQLAQRELNVQQQKEKSISEKSFDAMLKGLDLKSTGTTRDGRTDRDRDQQDTTIRQSAPPSRYKQLVEGYQQSVSGAKGSKP